MVRGGGSPGRVAYEQPGWGLGWAGLQPESPLPPLPPRTLLPPREQMLGCGRGSRTSWSFLRWVEMEGFK